MDLTRKVEDLDQTVMQHNTIVMADDLRAMRLSIYGFMKAKELAINYRRRLELEWDEQQKVWERLDTEYNRMRIEKKRQRKLLASATHASAPGFLDTIENPEAGG